MDPSRRLGRIGVRSGVLTANCDEMRIALRGRGGHAARPHETSDPIAAAAQLINAIYMFIPRLTDSQDAVVVTFGQVIAGDNANVIPERVELRGTIRTLDADVRAKTMAHIRRLATGVGQTVGADVEVAFREGTESVRNDPQLVELLRRAGSEVVGAGGIDPIPRPSMGSEDFAFYQARVPGAMFRLGCASERAGGAPLHSPVFDFDEEALRVGARILARAAVYWSEARAHDAPAAKAV
jgi:amidohydrolase